MQQLCQPDSSRHKEMADQMEITALLEVHLNGDSHEDFPIRINATRICNANADVRHAFAFVRQSRLTMDWDSEKEKTRSLF